MYVLHHQSEQWQLWLTPGDWPELVKVVATAGQHLLSVGSVQQRCQVAVCICMYVYKCMHGDVDIINANLLMTFR